MSCAPWNPTGCASDIAKSVAGDAFSSIAHDFGNVADSAINWLWAQTSSAAAVNLGGPGFALDASIVVAIAVTVALGLFLIQVITATVRRDLGGLGRAGRGLVVAFIGGGLAIAVTNLLLAAVDSLSAGVVQVVTGGSITTLGHGLLAGGTVGSVTTNPAGIILLSLAALVAVIMVWAALMVRKVLIVVSAVFAPIAFAGSLADITTAWVRRWIEVTAALIFSKLILVLIFLVGWGMLAKGVGQASHGGGPQTTTQAVSGLLVLTLAGFAPWLALKMVHWTGDQFHHLHTMAAASTAGAQKVMAAPQKVRPLAMAAMGAAGGGAAATAAGAGAGSGARPAERPGSGPTPQEPPSDTGSGSGGSRSGGPPAPAAPVTGGTDGGAPGRSLAPIAVSSAAAGPGPGPGPPGSGRAAPSGNPPDGGSSAPSDSSLPPPAKASGPRWPARAPTWVPSEPEVSPP